MQQPKRDEIEEATSIHDGPPPKKEAIHAQDHEEGGGHGGLEMGWLVSYADMMTLLFGLFVILFSLAQDKSKSVEQTMRQVSDKFFRDAGPAPTPAKDPSKNPESKQKDPTKADIDAANTPAPDAKEKPPVDDLQKEITELKATMESQQADFQKQIEEMKTEAEKAKAEAETAKSEAEEAKADKEAAEAKQAKVKKAPDAAKEEKKVQAAKKELESVKGETAAKKKELEAQKKEVADLKKEMDSAKKTIDSEKKTVEAEKKSVELQKKDLEAQKQQIADQKKQLDSEKKDVARKVASIDEKTKADAAKPDPTKLQADISALQQQMQQTKTENEKLKKDLAEAKKPTQNYMMVLLSWETEKHDLDLQVVDPRKKAFNFKKRQNKGEPGQFELDSRFGPGIEMWKSENFVAGQYRAQISLYAQNGNEAPAKARLTVITNLKTYISDPIEITKKGDARDIGFDVQSDGSVVFKGTAP